MKYSSLAVHCTSLCCDILQADNFLSLSHEDINWFYDDIYELIQQRTELLPEQYSKEHEFIKAVSLGVLKALHICRDIPKARNTTWILKAMQSRINYTFKLVYNTRRGRKRYLV